MEKSLKEAVMKALLACWNDPVLKAKVQEKNGETFIQLLDLVDYVAMLQWDEDLTVFAVDWVLRNDLKLMVGYRQRRGMCVDLNYDELAKKIDTERHGDAQLGSRLKPKRVRKGIWG